MDTAISPATAPPGRAGRRRLLLHVSALAISATTGVQRGYRAEAKRCHRRTWQCKARCERHYAAGTRELAVCRSLCGLGCWG